MVTVEFISPSAPMDDGIIVLHHHNALVGVEFEPAPDDEQRRIRAGFIEMRRRNRFENNRAARRSSLEQRAFQRRLNR